MVQNLLLKSAVGALAAAYLDAKYFISYDLHAIKALIRTRKNIAAREASDRFNMYYYLEENQQAKPKALFMIYQGNEWTNNQALELTHKWASYFMSLGIQKGDIVALNFTNKPAFIWAYFGLWAIGATPAFINFNLTGQPLLHCIGVCNAKLMVFDSEVADNVENVAETLKKQDIQLICYNDGQVPDINFAPQIKDHDIATLPDTKPNKDLRSGQKATDIATLIFTSGSTGMPKAAIVPWLKYSQGAYTSAALVGINENDRFYSCMPLYHGTASVLGIGICVLSSCTFVLGHKFSASSHWKEVSESGATIVQYVGEACRFLTASKPTPYDRNHKVRMAFGNGMRPDVWERYRQRFNVPTIVEFYASTEGVGGSFNYNNNSLGAGAVGKMGKLAGTIARAGTTIIRVNLDTEKELRDPKTGLCVQCGEGEPGELCYQIEEGNAEKTFRGYYNNDKATESKVIRDVLVKGDKYMRMGDLMSRDKDGFTYFVDRLGDTFRWKGENVSTTEVAEAIGNFPGIAEANVYGVQVPGHEGRAGCVAIDLDHERPLNYKALAAHCQKGLPKYAVPQFLRVVSKMAATGNYKQQKVGLRTEGIEHERVGDDKLFWLKDGEYVPFEREHIGHLLSGKARL
ncbi:hypothetical protein BCR37DRAFT_4655 [Protomyces lactucae-debilis]|uniref:Very long-chain fatty acid transport protein n=1 Tax=Protomyces lactucae-debilis TaxID=2754530 RepID=A0A1Y2FVT6_PROLT|nr:uncharacterized protein BCR37DRAFT_4655 [Protomyces lactucae-debilis]ORY87667.1 hypothetical protein BCR37DRAFT_4655 [Protomyces lactucae-debilis]